jgi:hypothetical protein
VARGEALNGVVEKLLCAGDGGGLVPVGEVGQGKKPWSETAYGKAAHGNEGVACVESVVALIEKREVAGDVTGGFDGAEGADEVAFVEESGGAGFNAGEASFDLCLRLVRLERFVGWFLEEREAAGVGDELDVCGAEFFEESVDGADVVHVSVGEENAADGRVERTGGGEDVVVGSGEAGVDEGDAVGLADEIAIDEGEAGELKGVGGDLGRLHDGI